VDAAVGVAAARRAIRVDGPLPAPGPLVVVELRPAPSIAAGPAQHGLAAVLDGVETVELAASPRDPARSHGRDCHAGAHRHEWEQEAVATPIAAAPRALVGRGRFAVVAAAWRVGVTHGAGRANFVAAAEVLSGR
jgi:beta-N-acetylhexosaminidase